MPKAALRAALSYSTPEEYEQPRRNLAHEVEHRRDVQPDLRDVRQLPEPSERRLDGVRRVHGLLTGLDPDAREMQHIGSYELPSEQQVESIIEQCRALLFPGYAGPDVDRGSPTARIWLNVGDGFAG